jgi:hypothetical protein
MKIKSVFAKGCALALFTILGAACNPFDVLDPRSPAAGPTGSNDMCAADPNLGHCPPPPPEDFKG